MNIYVVVEGETEKRVYPSWIPLVNPSLTYVDHPSKVTTNNFCIVSAMGYPFCMNLIRDAIEDVNAAGGFDRLVVLVDSEEATRDEKIAEISEHIAGKPCKARVIIAIQHFCFEVWALANRKLIDPKPTSMELRIYKNTFDVRNDDPEFLPAYPPRKLNRSQFAERYLVAAIQEKNGKLTYNKGRQAGFVAHPKYFDQVKRRLADTGHIPSFATFLEAFA